MIWRAAPKGIHLSSNSTHARLSVTVCTTISDAGAVLLDLHPRYDTADDNDASGVDRIVA